MYIYTYIYIYIYSDRENGPRPRGILKPVRGACQGEAKPFGTILQYY